MVIPAAKTGATFEELLKRSLLEEQAKGQGQGSLGQKYQADEFEEDDNSSKPKR